jgi:hypothetical protein
MPPRVTNTEWAALASAAGLRGFVIKSHLFPTVVTAHMLQTLHPELEIFGSITCNPTVGGLNPLSVEVAAQTGARLVWMPTWSAAQDPPHPSIFRDRMRPYLSTLDSDPDAAADIRVLDENGELTRATRRIVELCARYDLTLATGHLPIASSLVLAAVAQQSSVRLILTHPLSGSVGASIDDQLRIAELGGFVEHVFIGCMPMHQRMDPRRIVEAIDALGAEHIVLSSDAIEAWNPPQPEVLRMFIATLLALGVSEEAVYRMTHDNPAQALGIGMQTGASSSAPSETPLMRPASLTERDRPDYVTQSDGKRQ